MLDCQYSGHNVYPGSQQIPNLQEGRDGKDLQVRDSWFLVLNSEADPGRSFLLFEESVGAEALHKSSYLCRLSDPCMAELDLNVLTITKADACSNAVTQPSLGLAYSSSYRQR